jgi:pilus assembly protein CpaE
MHVTLVSSPAGPLAELVRACGAEVTTISPETATSPDAMRRPGVFLLALRDRSMVSAIVPAIRRYHPDSGIVLVTPALDTQLLLEAIRAGVNEVVAEPVTREDLLRAFAQVASQRAVETGRVFAFVGAKGGIGTTTVSVNVASALGDLSRPARALLIDLQDAGDASVFVGADPRFTLADALQNTHRLDQHFFRSLVVEVGAHTDLLASSDSASVSRDDTRLRAVVEFAQTVYRYVVLDVPRSAVSLLDALAHVDMFFIVANQDLATVKSSTRLAKSLRTRHGSEKVKVIISRRDEHADIGVADVARATGCEVAHTVPSDYRRAIYAINKGEPLIVENHNDLSASFRKFASGLAGIAPARKAARRAGLLERFTQRRSQ